ncbi:uncharacterized protein LOC101164799 isoform X4 [Oryzias latipes]|uniref:uncharacterized protein LOC101164799 isoform X4 n=1 Tax=Oryzias latipes TaxID=8090 RepID=UPI000CE20262|nr:uncharacterized protein LOC101164799 isoform X4 [Oryzias latipes]
MATSREKPKADDNPAGSLSNDEVTEKCGKLILVLKWSDSAKKDPKNLEKSLKSWSKKECKRLKISVVEILDDNNAVIKTEPYAVANLVQKLSGKELNLKNFKTVTVESVVLDSPKLDTQTTDEASMSYTPSTSDKIRQRNSQSDQDSIPEQSSRDEKKNLKDGNVHDKHTLSSRSNTSVPTSQRNKVDHKDATSSDIQEGSAEKMQKNSEKHKADSNPAGSLSEAERLDKGQMNSQSDKDYIPEQSSRDGKNNSKDGDVHDKHTVSSKSNTSVQTSQSDKVKRGAAASLDFSKHEKKVKTRHDEESKAEYSAAVSVSEAELSLSSKSNTSVPTSQRNKVGHKDATSSDIQEVSAEKMQKNSEKHKADSNPAGSLSEAERLDKGQMNSQSDKDYIPEQSSRDGKNNSKDGDVHDKHTLSSRSNTSVPTSQRDKVGHKDATSSDIQEGSAEKMQKNSEKHKADSNPAGSLSEAERLDKGQMNSQSDKDYIPEQSSRDGKNNSKDGDVQDKHTVSSKSNTSVQTSQSDKVKRGAAASLDFSKHEKKVKTRHDEESKADDSAAVSVSEAELSLSSKSNTSVPTSQRNKVGHKDATSSDIQEVSAEKMQKNSEKHKADSNPAGSLSEAERLDKGQMNSQSDKDYIPEQSSRDGKNNSKDGDVHDKHTVSSKSNTSVQTSQSDKVKRGAAASLDFSKHENKVKNRHDEESKADDSAAVSVSKAEVSDKKEKDEVLITLVLKWSKHTKKQQTLLQKSLQSWFNERKTGLSCSVVKILEEKNALINVKPSPALEILQILSGENLILDGTTVTVESVVLGSSKLKPQADETFLTPTSSTSDGKGIRQNQEEAVPVPVGFFWYLSQVYKEEIKRIEKENGCEMEVNLNVTFKAKQKDGSQQNALSEFTNLVQNHFNESRESVIPVQNVRPEQCSEAFKLIQKNEKKVLLTLTPKEITVRGPDSAQLKSVLERNGPGEKPYLLHDDPPLKMTIKDPLADAGMKMEEKTWKALDVDGKITKIKEKFDVDFQEVRRDGSKVQVKASYKGPEGNPFMDNNAVRALLRLYQKSITSPLNLTQLQGASGFRDSTTMHEDESEKRPVPEGGATGGDSTEENCPICLSPFTDKKSLNCKHEFCNLCLQQAKESNGPICPVCRKVFGIIQGDQPDGRMTWTRSSGQVPGFSNCGIITITYSIPNGTQTEKHPKPGHWYTGTTRMAYLPDNKEGNEVLKLLKKAFDQKLIFTIGASRTTGYENQVTWNDIHHKTSLYGGPDSYGYPDPTYLSRVREELKAKGIE